MFDGGFIPPPHQTSSHHKHELESFDARYKFALEVIRFRIEYLHQEAARPGVDEASEDMEEFSILRLDYPKPQPISRKKRLWDLLLYPKFLFREETFLCENKKFLVRTHWMDRFSGVETVCDEMLELEELNKEFVIELSKNL